MEPLSEADGIKRQLRRYGWQRVRFSVHDIMPWQSNRFRIFIWRDGEWHRVTEVIEANTNAGWILRYRTNPTGQKFVDETGEAAATERLEGWVCVDDAGSFWRELFGAINWVLLESRLGRTLLPWGISPYKTLKNAYPLDTHTHNP